MNIESNLDSFAALVEIIAKLRSPQGCPWDRAQTHASIKGNLIEESYEVLEAIDEQDMGKLCEELGDLLMQIVLQAQMASEDKDFELSDVVRRINEKLIRRHPHVFGDAKAGDAEQVIANWEALKREEGKGGESILEGVPKETPSLAYSQAIQRRAARVGFDWEDVEGVIEKLAEEVAELKAATEHQQRVKEFGDLLFTLANIARRLDIDLEGALRRANERFYRRFSYMEQLCRERGIALESLPLEEQDALWEEAKKKVKD
ncbi:Nucleoside triphosphate pyrophosphohydrolase/pyrophosphatase MazG [subsurface metagenome]